MCQTSDEALGRNKIMRVSREILIVLNFEIAFCANIIVVLDYSKPSFEKEQLLADSYLNTSILLAFLIFAILNTFRQSMRIFSWISGVSTSGREVVCAIQLELFRFS